MRAHGKVLESVEKKDLKSIDWLRQKVVAKNLRYPFWRIDKEKSIQIFNDGGWHFSYLLKPEEISKKFKFSRNLMG